MLRHYKEGRRIQPAGWSRKTTYDELHTEAGTERSFHTGAPELQQRIVFVKVPGQAGADRDGTLEAFARRRHSRLAAGGFFGGQMRIENEQDAAVVFAGKFADHQ